MAKHGLCSVQGCGKSERARGLCAAHYTRLKRHGDPLSGRVMDGGPLRWLYDLADHKGSACVIWPFRKRWNGYGEVSFRGKRTAASRVMCIIAHGDPESEDMHAAHSCGNGFGGCVNPKHVSWKTKSENETDKVDHGTSNRGERHGMSKLTSDDILNIRSLASHMTHKEIAKAHGVTRSTVGAIITRKRWNWM